MAPPKREKVPRLLAAQQSSTGRSPSLDDAGVSPLLSSSIYQITVSYHHTTVGEVQNVIHFKADTEPSGDVGDVLNDLINAYLDATQDLILPMLGNDSFLSSYSARRLSGGSPTVVIAPVLEGTAAGPVDNTAIACNIGFIPSSAPWNYGHFYVPMVPDDSFRANLFEGAYLVLSDALALALISPMVHAGGTLGLTWHAVIYSRKTNSARTIARYIRQARPVAIGRRIRPWSAGIS